MEALHVCPSTLAEGFDSYSPAAQRALFDGRKVSHVLDFNSPNNDNEDAKDYVKHVGRISLSGVQPKSGLVLDGQGRLVRPKEGERSQYILKPAPTSFALLERKYCPANEHLTMQLAAQVYHIETAANARLEFFDDGNYNYWRKNDNGEWEAVTDREFQNYFVDGTLLATRWKNPGEAELREWWEIASLANGQMQWTALRQNADGTTAQQGMKWTKM